MRVRGVYEHRGCVVCVCEGIYEHRGVWCVCVRVCTRHACGGCVLGVCGEYARSVC